MANPELLSQLRDQDISPDDGKPVEGKSFENLRRFVAYGTIAPVTIYLPGEKPDYSDRNIYYPSAKGTNLQNWERNLRMVWDYAFSEETLKEIGKRNGNHTREDIRTIVKRTVILLHDSAPEEARDRFPFESFNFRKPMTIASRQRYSEAKGGKSLGIAGKLSKGATLEGLKKDYTSQELCDSRPVVESWGVKLERAINPILSQFEGLKNLSATDQEIQAELDKIMERGKCQVLRKASLVLDLTTLAKKAGLYIGPHQLHFVSESLRKEQLPLPQRKVPHKIKDKHGQERTVHYHIIAAIHEGKAIDILRADRSLDNLRTNPVRQIAGPTAKLLPNTTALKSEEYRPVSNLIGQIRRSRWAGMGKGGVKTADIIQSAPVGIYFMRSRGIFFRKDQEGELRAHLESRLRYLDMI